MTMLPSIHDHCLIEYRVHLSDRQVVVAEEHVGRRVLFEQSGRTCFRNSLLVRFLRLGALASGAWARSLSCPSVNASAAVQLAMWVRFPNKSDG